MFTYSVARKSSLGNFRSFIRSLLWGITSLNSAAGTATIKAELGNQVSFMRTGINHCTHESKY